MAKMRQAAGPKREDAGDEVAQGQQKIFRCRAPLLSKGLNDRVSNLRKDLNPPPPLISNTEKKVGNTTCRGVFLTNYEV